MTGWIIENKDWLNVIINFFAALGTFGAVVISLYMILRKKKFYKITDKFFNPITDTLTFNLYNLKEYPMEIAKAYSKPDVLIHKNGWSSINTELDLKIRRISDGYTRRKFFKGNNTDKNENDDLIQPHSFVKITMKIPNRKHEIDDSGGKKIGILIQNKIIIVTNFGAISLRYPYVKKRLKISFFRKKKHK